MLTAFDCSPTGLWGSFDTPAISSLANIIRMHQKISRYEKDTRDVSR